MALLRDDSQQVEGRGPCIYADAIEEETGL
jgi:hypothetical protein